MSARKAIEARAHDRRRGPPLPAVRTTDPHAHQEATSQKRQRQAPEILASPPPRGFIDQDWDGLS